MTAHATRHTRKFLLTVKFTNAERARFFSRKRRSLKDDLIADALISEVTDFFEGLGLQATMEEVD